MSQKEKLLSQILTGRSDANVNFNDLINLLQSLGFEQRIRGSHHILTREGIEEIINLQPKGAKAKAYQVRQIRQLIVKYRLGGLT
jgi:predicted RNA binding protein YcfA (HicA-like mRNA interferase family)